MAKAAALGLKSSEGKQPSLQTDSDAASDDLDSITALPGDLDIDLDQPLIEQQNELLASPPGRPIQPLHQSCARKHLSDDMQYGSGSAAVRDSNVAALEADPEKNLGDLSRRLQELHFERVLDATRMWNAAQDMSHDDMTCRHEPLMLK